MTLSEFRLQIKSSLDKADAGEKVVFTRGGKIYQIKRVN